MIRGECLTDIDTEGRRYSHNTAGAVKEPAVLECAWVEKTVNPSEIQIYTDSVSFKGLGHILDSQLSTGAFDIRECAGVPDAVRLTDTTHPNHPYNVAVVYPHQIEFGNAAGTNPRKFDLRIATCSLDVSQPTPQVSSDNTYLPFDTGVQFNGAVSPGTIPSPGLILPDLAPSSEENAFWAVHERQSKKTLA